MMFARLKAGANCMHFSMAPSAIIIISQTLTRDLNIATYGLVIIIFVDLAEALRLESMSVDLTDHFLHELHGSLRSEGEQQHPSKGHQNKPHLDVAAGVILIIIIIPIIIIISE